MLCSNTILKISPDVLKRYESNLVGGTFFLYNTINKDFWTGNKASYEILKLIDGKKTVQVLYDDAKNIFKGNDINAIINSIDVLLFELIEKNYIITL